MLAVGQESAIEAGARSGGVLHDISGLKGHGTSLVCARTRKATFLPYGSRPTGPAQNIQWLTGADQI